MARHAVKVFDLAPAAMAQAVAAGSIAATSAVDAVAEADVVISMLPASRHVEGLYLGENGLLLHIPDGALVIDCSTIAPASVQKVAKAAAARGLSMIDAPVSGGTTGATAGMLTFIIGDEDRALEWARPILGHMRRHIFHVGTSGAGQVAQLCNNMVLGVIMAVTGEALALGVTCGLDARVLSQMMAVSTGRSWATEVCNLWPGVLENALALCGYTGGFGNALMLKDLGLAVEAAIGVGESIPLGELACNLYAMNSRAGHGARWTYPAL